MTFVTNGTVTIKVHGTPLVSEWVLVVCPYCGSQFYSERGRWVARHECPTFSYRPKAVRA